jgi:hypothetical protein
MSNILENLASIKFQEKSAQLILNCFMPTGRRTEEVNLLCHLQTCKRNDKEYVDLMQ